ncbi:MAG: hypothetical protein P1V35_11950, partial [Planctomycetota bacterium]|nr:hypothetical protein [Planctomycetota bacterium]
ALVRLRTMRRAFIIAPILLTMAAALLGGPLALIAVTLSLFSLAWALRCNRFILLLIRSPLPTSKTLLTHRW